MAEVDTADTDVLAVIDIGNAGIAHTHYVQSVAPRHGLCLHATIGVERLQLLQGLLVKPVGNFSDLKVGVWLAISDLKVGVWLAILNGAVGTIGDFSGRHRTALMVLEGLEVHQVVVLTEDIGMSLVVADAGVVATVTVGRTHDVALRLPWSLGRVAHGIAQCLWTTGGGIGQIVMAITLVEPRAFLIVV